MFSFYVCLYSLLKCYRSYSTHLVSLSNSFLFEVMGIIMFHRRSVYSFLLDKPASDLRHKFKAEISNYMYSKNVMQLLIHVKLQHGRLIKSLL